MPIGMGHTRESLLKECRAWVLYGDLYESLPTHDELRLLYETWLECYDELKKVAA